MKVLDLSFMNLDELYKIIYVKSKDANHSQKMFGNNFPQLLSHVTFVFHLSEVTKFEYLLLKMYSSSVTDFVQNDLYDTYEFVKENYNKIDVSSFFELLNSIIIKDDIDFQIEEYLPLGFISGNCSVTFTGEKLLSLISLNPESFFLNGSNRKCIELPKNSSDDNSIINFRKEYIDEINSDEDMINFIIQTFITNFYKFLVSRVENMDLISDSFVFNNYLENINNEVKMMTIVNPYLFIDFLNDDINEITTLLKEYKEMELDNDVTMKHTKIKFGIETTLNTFIDLYSLLPQEKFVSLESFQLVLNNPNRNITIPECPKELVEKYLNRYERRLHLVLSKVKENYSKNEDKIKFIELTNSFEMYKFVIELSFDDINNYLLKDINNPNLSKLVTDIINYSKSIYVNMN